MKVLIVDDDKLVGISLKTIIEADSDITVCGVAISGNEAIKLYKETLPDILLMDIRMADLSGIEVAQILIKEYKSIKILFLTTFADDNYIITALKLGAKGYLLKQNFESIVPAIKAVYAGQTVFGDHVTSKFPGYIKQNNAKIMTSFNLTLKEQNIIKLIADGLNNKEISEKLYMSEGTIRNNISSILEKLNLRDRTQIAIFYYKNM